MLIALAAATAPIRAQERVQARRPDSLVQNIYAGLQENIRKEYLMHLNGAARQLQISGAPSRKIEPVKARLRQLSYNKAALIAFCIADAEQERGPNAPPLPPGRNLVATTCVEIKLTQMQRFSDLAAYAGFFFPERVETCGESSRLPEREAVLRPYEFLELAEPKLFDFPRYNECLMTRKGAVPQ